MQRKFEEFLISDHLEHGFFQVRCENFKHERLVASSCKRRGCCPSYGAQRMAESAALFVDEVLLRKPIHQ
ncbi:MAG: hypothetical protein COA46_08655 [Porticoccaceae bacterium]|nr:MAG: hypothetical protein COA46_08655 [Porticoccaceae bacterium]